MAAAQPARVGAAARNTPVPIVGVQGDTEWEEIKMKTLPNGLAVFNATPHPITFWDEEWGEIVTAEPDRVINATPIEELVDVDVTELQYEIQFVCTRYVGNDEGRQIAEQALQAGADVVVGSIIAAEAYPGLVVAMVPVPGFERVPPEEKRMRPDKFTTFA